MGCTSAQPQMPATTIDGGRQESHQGFKVPSSVKRDTEEGEFHNDWLLGIKLGRGAFAQVRLATARTPKLAPGVKKDEFAVKVLSMHEANETQSDVETRLQKASREASFWKKVVQHPNCVFIHSFFCGNSFCYMVMEKCDKGLFQSLETMPDITERGFGNILAQMLLGIAHCHSCNVMHRDIKPDNFLVGGSDGGGTVKLADFGFSTPITKTGKATGIYGTAPFMCPEMLIGESYDEKADVWSLAVIVYTFLFGSFPYTPTKESTQSLSASRAMKRAVRTGATPSFEPNSSRAGAPPNGQMRSEEAMHVAKSLLHRDPPQRPSAEEALQMPWLAASLQGNHLPEVDLPSLRPMLYAAKKAGAFELRDARKTTPDDELLNRLQQGRSKADASDMPDEKPVGGTKSSASKGASSSPRRNRPGDKDEWETQSNRSTKSGSSSGSRSDQIRWSRCGSHFSKSSC